MYDQCKYFHGNPIINIRNGLNYTGATIIDKPDRGSISVTFGSPKNSSRKTVHFQTQKIVVLRKIFHQCNELDNVLHCQLN